MTKDQTPVAQATTTDDTLAGGAIVEAEITLDLAQIETALENIAALDAAAPTIADGSLGGGGENMPTSMDGAEGNSDEIITSDVDAPQAVQGIPTDHQHPTLAQMRAAIEMIEGGNNAFGREELRHVIERECGTAGELMTDDLQPSGVFEVEFMGITATSPASIDVALTVWCSKARRAIMSGIYTDEPAASAAE